MEQNNNQEGSTENPQDILQDNTIPQDQSQLDTTKKIMDEYNPFEKPEVNSDIEITVGDPVQRDETFSKYIVYNIKGQDEHGSFEVYRRYNDFFELRKVMVQRWPGCFIPPIPPKKTVGSTDSQVVDDRKKHLNNFCLKVSMRRHLYYSEEFQQFLRSKDADIGKVFEKMAKYRPKDIIEKYKDQFSQLNGKEITQNLLLDINNFMGYLKKAKQQLTKFKDTVRSVSSVKKQYNHVVTVLIDSLLPEYEKHCISQYSQGDSNQLIFNNENNVSKIKEIRQVIKDQTGVNSFEYICDMICFEYRDCEAFIEAIEQKDYYEKIRAKLQAKIRDQQEELLNVSQGKKTFKSFFKSGDVETQKQRLENEINFNNAEAENTSTLIDLITGILGFIEVDSFKAGKTRTYHKVMQNSASLEIMTSSKMIDFWKDLSQEAEHQLNTNQE